MFEIASFILNVLFSILNLHECKIAIHILSGNETESDYNFINQLSLISNVEIWVQDRNIDMSYETCKIGKACILSLSEEALGNVSFQHRCKRPVKILLGSFDTSEIPKPDYEPVIIEEPPVMSIFTSSLSTSTVIVTTKCPEIENEFIATFYEEEMSGTLSKCDPYLVGMEFRLTGLGFDPFFWVNTNGKIVGFERDTVQTLVDKVGGTLIVDEAVDWFSVTESGEYVGCVPEIYFKRATFAASQNMYMYDVSFFIDSIAIDYQPFFYRSNKPKALPPTWNLFKPFSTTVWICFITVLIILMAFYSLFNYMYEVVHPVDKKTSLFNNALSIYMHQLSQNMNEKDGKTLKMSMRIFLMFFYLYAFMIHAFYDCNLRAYLMIVEFEPHVDTSKDIYEQGRKLYIQDKAEYDEEEKYASLPSDLHFHLKKLAAETYKNKYFYSSSPGNNSNHHYAFSYEFEKETIEADGVISIVERSFKAIGKDIRGRWDGQMPFRLSKVENPIYFPYIVTPVPKHSVLFERFNLIVQRLWSGHIINQLAKFYYLDYNDVKEEKGLEPIKMGHILTGTYGCVIGLVLAITAFIAEQNLSPNSRYDN